MSRADFLDMLGASNLVPGPSSTEMAIHIGHQRAGWRGLITAGSCFIIPAMLIVMACAWISLGFMLLVSNLPALCMCKTATHFSELQ